MALTTKRIIALPSQTDPQEGDYLAIDNATSGTHKIPVGRVGVEVDDTLTEAGKAADAKAVGDALDEIRSQIEVTGTASGAIATFTDGSDAPMKSCIVSIEPQQSGSGTPSPSNIRPISGWESVNVYVSPTEDEADGHTTTTSLGRTVYGGTLDVVSGVLTVDKIGTDILIESIYNRSGSDSVGFGVFSLPYAWSTPVDIICEKGFYVGSFNTTTYGGVVVYDTNRRQMAICCPRDYTVEECQAFFGDCMLVYELATPQTYQLTPTEVNTLLGENNVWADSGDVEVVYVRDLNITINNLLNSNGTRSLGMMAMSAPAEATAEEPTGEQTEEPAEDDMR